MKSKIKEYLKTASMLIGGGFVNIMINYLFLKNLILSALIEIPKILMSLVGWAIWFSCWNKIEKIINKIKKKKFKQ